MKFKELHAVMLNNLSPRLGMILTIEISKCILFLFSIQKHNFCGIHTIELLGKRYFLDINFFNGNQISIDLL